MAKRFNVVITKKGTKEQSILESNLTEAKAEKMCEEWGWSYDDGEHSYFMGIEEM